MALMIKCLLSVDFSYISAFFNVFYVLLEYGKFFSFFEFRKSNLSFPSKN